MVPDCFYRTLQTTIWYFLIAAVGRGCQPIVLLERFHEPKCYLVRKPTGLLDKSGRLSEQWEIKPYPRKQVLAAKKQDPTLTRANFARGLDLRSCAETPKGRIKKRVVPVLTISLAKPKRRRTLSEASGNMESHVNNGNTSRFLLSPATPKNNHVAENVCETPEVDSDSEDDTEDLLNVDITSPLGQRLTPALEKRNLGTSTTIKDFDHYCNQTGAIAEENRRLRSQTNYCKLLFIRFNENSYKFFFGNFLFYLVSKLCCFTRRKQVFFYKGLCACCCRRSFLKGIFLQ